MKPRLRCAETRIAKLCKVSKGFNWVCAKLLVGCADSRFAKPRTSGKETILFFSLVRKERGVPQRFANLWTPGTIQISARYIIFAEVTGVHHVTGRAGNRKVSGYRRWGFESVRKGGYTSDARLRSFENGLFCCKLTVASGIQKGLLHVSLGVVQSWSFACWEKAFLYRLALHESKKQACFAKQKRFFFVETLSNYTRKLPFLRTKAFLLHKPFFAGLKNFPFP